MEAAFEQLEEHLSSSLARAAVVLTASLIITALLNAVLPRILLILARTTKSELDDTLVELLRPPVLWSAILVSLYVASRAAELTPTTLSIIAKTTQTLAVLVWLSAGLKISSRLLEAVTWLAGRVSWLQERTVPLFENMAKVLLFAVALYMFLLTWDLDVKPWLASAGIVGIAVGFAAKDTLANLFGGLFIIIDAPYKIGDFINLGPNERGRVTKIGLRSTRLVTRDDVEIILPNAQIANSKIVNESGGPSVKRRVSITVGVAYGSDVELVRQTLIEAVAEVPEVTDEPEPSIQFNMMGDSALIFRVKCWVGDPSQYGRCVDGLNTSVYRHLVARGISIPFPQREVLLKRDKSEPPGVG